MHSLEDNKKEYCKGTHQTHQVTATNIQTKEGHCFKRISSIFPDGITCKSYSDLSKAKMKNLFQFVEVKIAKGKLGLPPISIGS
jgi:hypothetical protein